MSAEVGRSRQKGLTMNEPVLDLEQIRAELSAIEGSDLPEHVARYEALHAKLVDALKSIEDI